MSCVDALPLVSVVRRKPGQVVKPIVPPMSGWVLPLTSRTVSVASKLTNGAAVHAVAAQDGRGVAAVTLCRSRRRRRPAFLSIAGIVRRPRGLGASLASRPSPSRCSPCSTSRRSGAARAMPRCRPYLLRNVRSVPRCTPRQALRHRAAAKQANDLSARHDALSQRCVIALPTLPRAHTPAGPSDHRC